jgi:hypothetical protein
MKKFKLSLIAASLVAVAGGANASLVLDGAIDQDLTGQGFGAVPRILTLQARAAGTTESVAIGVTDSSIVSLEPGIPDAQVFNGNGFTNPGGTGVVNPLTDNNKYAIPTLGELLWTSPEHVNLLFNGAEPGSDADLTVQDVTLKFYDGNTVIAAIDGNFTLTSTDPGVGNAGFLVNVDAAQQAFLLTAVFDNPGAQNYRIALESTINGVAGGPETFSALSQPIPEPGTYAMMLAGLGLLGFARIRRQKRDGKQ